MEKILRGFLKFRRNLRPKIAPLYKKLAAEQHPEVLLITCSDSRVVPSLMTSTGPGELFIVRNVGNLIPPCTDDGISLGDVSEASAIEYSMNVLGIKNIVICGHSNCGAMRALMTGKENLTTSPNLVRWLAHGDSAKDRIQKINFSAKISDWDRLSQANVTLQLEHLMTYPSVKERLARKELFIFGAWFDIENAALHAYEPAERRFVYLDDKQIEKRLNDGGAKLN